MVSGQVAYGGHLLYGFANDTAPGQTNGVGLPDWNLLGPFANVMTSADRLTADRAGRRT